MTGGIHENFSREDSTRGSSDRSFGWVFTGFSALLAFAPLLRGKAWQPWALAVSSVFLLLTLFRPALLHPLNRLWTRLAALISKVTNPIFTGFLFYVLFTPLAIVLRLMGKDLLRLKSEPAANTYWISRDPLGPPSESMRNQF